MHNTLAHRLRLCLSNDLVYEQNNKSGTVPIKYECGQMKHTDCLIFSGLIGINLNIFCRICSVNVLIVILNTHNRPHLIRGATKKSLKEQKWDLYVYL